MCANSLKRFISALSERGGPCGAFDSIILHQCALNCHEWWLFHALTDCTMLLCFGIYELL